MTAFVRNAPIFACKVTTFFSYMQIELQIAQNMNFHTLIYSHQESGTSFRLLDGEAN